MVVDESVRRKFCTNVHSLTLKRVKCCFAYVEWCIQIFEEFVDIFYKTKASLYFNVKAMICLASFDACLLGIQKGQDIINKEKV